MKTRTKYDSVVPWLYAQQKEHLLPEYFRNGIPFSTIASWRNGIKPYHGAEFARIRIESLEWNELLHERENLKSTIRTICKVWISVSDIVLPILNKKQEHWNHTLDAIQQLQSKFGKRIACKLSGISVHTFSYRLGKIKFKCGISPLDLCFKRHPSQLTQNEVKTISEAFQQEQYACWPAASIYFHLLRNKKLNISISTFYKYVNLLGLKRKWQRKKPKTKGIVSSKPNEFLHIDTTFWEFTSGIKVPITLVSDNFSRAILAWKTATTLNADLVKDVLNKCITNINETYPNELQHVKLVSDGGSENNNHTIHDLLKATKRPIIQKIIAQKDISFSNSPIEAINKILKRYLRKHKPDNLQELEKVLPKIINDYQNLRPHASLNGLTPNEAYTQQLPIFDFKQQLLLARSLRIKTNRTFNCKKS